MSSEATYFRHLQNLIHQLVLEDDRVEPIKAVHFLLILKVSGGDLSVLFAVTFFETQVATTFASKVTYQRL